jgi:hypothetical protein
MLIRVLLILAVVEVLALVLVVALGRSSTRRDRRFKEQFRE